MDPQAYLKAVQEVWSFSKEAILKGDIEQIVLDEIGLAISLGYLQEEDVTDTLQNRSNRVDVILSGPAIPNRIMNMADQITELRSGN